MAYAKHPEFENVLLFPGVNVADLSTPMVAQVPAVEIPTVRPAEIKNYDPENWKSARACQGLDPNIFIRQDRRSIAIAKGICSACIVRQECLDEAPAQGGGTRGGYSEKEREGLSG